MRIALFCLTLVALASPCPAQEALGLASPDDIERSGLLQHILPRFSLKTGIRVTADPAGPMELATAADSDPVFRRGDTIYYLRTDGSARQERFRDWLLSDIGKRTIEAFAPPDGPVFSASFETVEPDEAPVFDGNAERGAQLSAEKCGRCHVVGEQNRMKGIGSTPSFAVLRALPDWDVRFQSFYALRPHPAFTQVEGITDPFDAERPSPIHPVLLTPEELEAILAFVSATGAADLGAPLILK